MAAKDLPIYRSATRLISLLYDSTKKAPRDLRHTLVQRLLDETVEVCVGIVEANRVIGADRIPRVERLRQRITRTETLLTVALEQRCISKGAAATAMEHVDSLGRQATGWLEKTKEGAAATRKAPATTAD